jgi:hypothetical protein
MTMRRRRTTRRRRKRKMMRTVTLLRMAGTLLSPAVKMKARMGMRWAGGVVGGRVVVDHQEGHTHGDGGVFILPE